MRQRILILFILISVPVFLLGESEREKLFSKANQAYEAGQMQEALERYLDLLYSGEVSFQLYYNLGNAYYRMGKIGRAIQYWEKAALLQPQNGDLNHNLELARLKILDRVVLPKAFFLFEYYWDFRSSADMLSWLKRTIWLAFFTLFFWFLPYWLILGKNIRSNLNHYLKIPKIILLILFSASILISIDAIRYNYGNHQAIVISNEVQVKSAPLISSNTLFILHEGSKVNLILDENKEWYKISYYGDKSGWVRREDLGEI
ncbi:MAG TPA: tetratricopeptide repeat protein [Candidatus Marinimicrobia bacterium]|nr:tetratricopeptide repeat protein [Candidatus Neomarinimicrobiota bacterium]